MSLEIKKYKHEVEKLLLQRNENGSLESEADFIAGASIAFTHFDVWNKIPPMWIMCPMSGRSIIEELGFKKGPENMVTIKIDQEEHENN